MGSVSSLLLFLSVVFYLSALDNRANLAGQGESLPQMGSGPARTGWVADLRPAA